MIAHFKAVTVYFLNFCRRNSQKAHFYTKISKYSQITEKKIELEGKRLLITL